MLNATQTLADHLAFTRYDGSKADSVEMPALGADNGLALVSMIGADYDDPQWDTLLDQLTFNEMVNTITLGFHNTAAIESIGKTRTKDENGPQGLTAALTGGASAMCYTSEDVMAATFNVDLINDVGRCIGEDCLAMGYSGLYGPGINMHRTAYSGRNFEYYASDPFVAGTICAAEVNGIQSKGVYVYLKHVALNDSESSRQDLVHGFAHFGHDVSIVLVLRSQGGVDGRVRAIPDIGTGNQTIGQIHVFAGTGVVGDDHAAQAQFAAQEAGQQVIVSAAPVSAPAVKAGHNAPGCPVRL